MIDVRVLRAMHAAGATIETIFAAIEADQAEQLENLAKRREQNRKAQRNHRSRQHDRVPVSMTEKISNGINDRVSNGHADRGDSFFLSYSTESQSQKKNKSPPGFLEFWPVYPKKVGKLEAERAYAKALKKSNPAEILDGLKRQLRKLSADLKYCPNPATWLNQGRWLDESINTPASGWAGISGVI